MISLICAVAQNRVIGKDGSLPWDLPTDLKYFRDTTKYSAVIMGRKTFESIGHPLKDRTNIVITRNKAWANSGVVVANSLDYALGYLDGMSSPNPHTGKIFIIGGAEIYKAALPIADEILLTDVACEPDGDALFPVISPKEWSVEKEGAWLTDAPDQPRFRFLTMKRVQAPNA